MSSFSNTPHLLTKEKLKSALKANGIPLPRTDQKKAFYVDLYLQKLTSQNDHDEDISSDESEEVSESSPMGSSKKLPQKPQQKIVVNKRVKGGLPFDVTALSDGDLARQLKSFGATVGPINDSTRPLYQKKLAKLLTGELQAPAVSPIVKLSPKQTKASPSKLRRKKNADFSDENDGNDASAEEDGIEMVEQLDYNHDKRDQEDSRPHKMPPPSYRSTPAKSTPRKRVVTSTTTTLHTRRVHSENKGETADGLEQTDSVEMVAVRKITQPEQEGSTLLGPHIQILLAVLVFMGFTAFLVYYLMEETPHREISTDKNAANN